MPADSNKAPELAAVLLELEAASSFEAIEDLSSALAPTVSEETASRLTAMAVARESLASTFLGHGIALPHARLPDPVPFCFAMGRSENGVPWGASAEKVHLIFLSVVPTSAATAYLGFVRKLAIALRDEKNREFLRGAADRVSTEQWLRGCLGPA